MKEARQSLGDALIGIALGAGLALTLTGCNQGTGTAITLPQQAALEEGQTNVRVYAVGRKVSEFPANEDLSTPEAAYAACNRVSASGEQGRWRQLSVKHLAVQLPADAKKINVGASAAQEWLTAEIVEVRIHRNDMAMVFARIPHPRKTIVDIRTLEFEGGRWLNSGNDVVGSLEEARALFTRRCAHREAQRRLYTRPPIAQPDEHLRPFVEFLQHEAADPEEFLLDSLANHRVVILGEVHHRPRYWAFNAALVQAPRFPQVAGAIYLELPGDDQALVDQFLEASEYDPQPIVETLRDMLWMGWPDQPMLDFFKTVWKVNQSLPREQRLRVVLVDMDRPWERIQERDDWRKFDVDRNQLMADNIVRDLRQHSADGRNALFIVGYLHATVNLSRPDGDPVQSAGWHLRETQGGTNVFAVFPHSPVMANMGGVSGRLALGLFETAFAALQNQPVVFPLDRGPFGEQVFDASLDELTTDPYERAFHAYLYLGPLEDEVFSPLIPGFYTDDFVQELERRSQVMFGKGLVEGHGMESADAAGFVQWMSQTWGQPRRDWSSSRLGPLNAWHYGSDWETKLAEAKLRNWPNETNAIRQAAIDLINAVRGADYEHPGDWRSFPTPDVSYTTKTDYPGWMRWICQRFRTNPIVQIEFGQVVGQPNGRPAVPYEFTLQDGAHLKGVLPMEWSVRAQQWSGLEGLDWHLAPDPWDSNAGVQPATQPALSE